jgi:dipeptidyl aminopeptidase/acylaminoacyl peptidase
LRAMLTAPEIFHAGVAGAPGELTEAASINEPYMGLMKDNPEGYANALNAPLASKLKGQLLLVHGAADVNAPFSKSMRMAEALIEADKYFDLLVLPGAAHSFRGAQLRYEAKRIQAFFLKHLRDEELPGGSNSNR